VGWSTRGTLGRRGALDHHRMGPVPTPRFVPLGTGERFVL